jgi:hypothetical protein
LQARSVVLLPPRLGGSPASLATARSADPVTLKCAAGLRASSVLIGAASSRGGPARPDLACNQRPAQPAQCSCQRRSGHRAARGSPQSPALGQGTFFGGAFTGQDSPTRHAAGPKFRARIFFLGSTFFDQNNPKLSPKPADGRHPSGSPKLDLAWGSPKHDAGQRRLRRRRLLAGGGSQLEPARKRDPQAAASGWAPRVLESRHPSLATQLLMPSSIGVGRIRDAELPKFSLMMRLL